MGMRNLQLYLSFGPITVINPNDFISLIARIKVQMVASDMAEVCVRENYRFAQLYNTYYDAPIDRSFSSKTITLKECQNKNETIINDFINIVLTKLNELSRKSIMTVDSLTIDQINRCCNELYSCRDMVLFFLNLGIGRTVVVMFSPDDFTFYTRNDTKGKLDFNGQMAIIYSSNPDLYYNFMKDVGNSRYGYL